MDQRQFLSTLRDMEVIVRLGQDSSLDIEAPKGVLTPDLVEQIKARKPALINYLQEIHQVAATMPANIQPAAPAASYPLSSSQKRLWTIQEMNPDSPAYNMYQVKTYAGPLDKNALQHAVEEVVKRHEMLRTVFREDGAGEVRQWILHVEEISIDISYIDLRYDKQGEEKMEQTIREDRFRPFSMSEWPLFRIMVFQCKEDAWILYYNMHHLIGDGWSMNVLAYDIGRSYEAFQQGSRHTYPAPELQYKDYAVWQQTRLQTGMLASHQAYWLKQLAGELPVFNLPFSKIRPAVATSHGWVLSTRIDTGLTQALQYYCQQQQASVFMGLLALLQVLFYRYTGQKDILMGTPVAGREQAALEDQIGFYVNTVVLRADFDGDRDLATVLTQVRDTVLSAYEHQDYPFDELVDQLSIKRDSSRSPVFDVMVVSDNQALPAHHDKAPIQGSGIIDHGEAAAKFDLTITFEESGEDIGVYVNFNTDLYDPSMIARMMAHYKQLLQAALGNTKTAVSRLVYLSVEEQQQLLKTFNNTTIDWAGKVSLLDMFEEQATLYPERTAAVYEEETITYGALHERSDQVGRYLNHRQVKPGDLVVICMHRSIDMITGILGILKAGAAYVPVAPDYPVERIQYILSDCGAAAVLTQTSCSGLFREQEKVRIIAIDGDWPQIEKEGSDQKLVSPDADSLAYVIYTSGSTGRPKGVMIEQRSVVNLVRSLHAHIYQPYTGVLRIALVAAYTFDASVKQLFVSLLLGHTLYIVPDGTKSSGDGLWAYYRDNKIDVSDGTPAHLYLLCQDLPEDVSIKHFLIGGEALPATLVDLLYGAFRQTAHQPVITNVYGPTEACVDSSLFTAWPQRSFAPGTLPIGKPVHNVQLYILDPYQQLLPIGVQGELYIGGRGLARGYINNEALTKEVFIQHPFSNDAGERLYRTGDLAKWLPDGEVQYTGRTDDVVKVRGYRIGLKEIAGVIDESRLVKQCVVLVKLADDGVTGLVAYIVPEGALDKEQLVKYLKSKVPQYMIPDHFVFIDHIPLTTNGKIDTSALSMTAVLNGTDAAWEYVAPRNEAEQQLATIVATVLEKSQQEIGIEDSFFDLGANSITLVKIVRQINNRWKMKMKVVSLFQYPNIRSLADNFFNHDSREEEKVVEEGKKMDDLLSIFED